MSEETPVRTRADFETFAAYADYIAALLDAYTSGWDGDDAQYDAVRRALTEAVTHE